MISGLHHVAVLTADIDAAVAQYVALLGGQTPRQVLVDRPGVRLKSAMLPLGKTGATFLQIIQPIEGPGVEELQRGGEGALFEVGFQVEDIEGFNGALRARGASPLDLAERPITQNFIPSKYGNRYSFVPRSITRGTRVEIVQVMREETNQR
jgi:catechol 2,3-dioxygenase-like lactoylglutathione lyase family enzyme